jgi:hypothetical protein
MLSVFAASLGILSPLILLRLGWIESVFTFFAWPSSIALRVPHVWPSETSAAMFFAVVVLLNGVVYWMVAFVGTRNQRKRVSRSLAGSTIVVVCSVLALLTGTVAVLGRPIFYEFAPEYHGWAIIEYANPSCSPLTSRGINQIVQFPSSGRICTSSPRPLPDTFRYAMYAYVDKSGSKRLSPCQRDSSEICVGRTLKSSQRGDYPTRAVFVGTQRDFSQQIDN